MTERQSADGLLTAPTIRELAARLGLRPTKTLGQNFVIDPNTVRRIVRTAEVTAQDTVLEVGPGLGSLTIALLDAAAGVVAVEIDPVLAGQLPQTVTARRPDLADRLTVLTQDALTLTPDDIPGPAPTALVANLPYNVAVPVLLTLLERFPSLRQVLVMVQAEVADRLAAGPGSRTYGAPSAKAAWYADTRRAGDIGRSIFWPVPNVDSALVAMTRRPEPASTAGRQAVFAVVDAAFAQRRKTLRAALAGWAGSAPRAEELLRAAGIDPGLRGERLDIAGFVAIADAAPAPGAPAASDPAAGAAPAASADPAACADAAACADTAAGADSADGPDPAHQPSGNAAPSAGPAKEANCGPID